MIRNLKALGLAFVVAVALSAVGASAASATTHDFECNALPGKSCWVTGYQHTPFVFETNTGKKAECKNVGYVGTMVDKTQDDLTLTPTFGECEFAGLEATVSVNGGCTATFTGATDELGDAEVHTCPTGGNITIKVLGGACTLTVGAQTRRGVHYDNVLVGGIEEITMTTTVKKISFTKAGICSEVGETAEMRGSMTLAAYEDLGVNGQGNPIEGNQLHFTTTVKVP